MANLSIGFLFKKKYITYQLKKWEIFEFIDYTTAISFTYSVAENPPGVSFDKATFTL